MAVSYWEFNAALSLIAEHHNLSDDARDVFRALLKMIINEFPGGEDLSVEDILAIGNSKQITRILRERRTRDNLLIHRLDIERHEAKDSIAGEPIFAPRSSAWSDGRSSREVRAISVMPLISNREFLKDIVESGDHRFPFGFDKSVFAILDRD